MYTIFRGKSLGFMNDIVEEFDTKYYTISLYGVELDEDSNKKAKLSSTKIQHNFHWV